MPLLMFGLLAGYDLTIDDNKKKKKSPYEHRAVYT